MILYALSIKQPWLYAILHLGKNVENRTWELPEQYRGKDVLMHVGKKMDVDGYSYLTEERGYTLPPLESLPRGGIVGTCKFLAAPADPEDPETENEWAEPDLEHWYIADQRELPFFRCKGSLGFFKVDYPFAV
jgi:hypothetical protein